MKDIFEKIADAPPSAGGQYWEEGNFIVEVQVNKIIESTRKEGELIYIIECKCLKSDNEKVPVGSCRSHVINLSNYSAVNNVKNHLMAALNCESEDISPDMVKECCSEENPLAGIQVKLETFVKPTQSGGDFTHHRYSVLPKKEWIDPSDTKEISEDDIISY